MNYRQWKKKYKKEHGYNPPLSEDKRQQAKALRKIAKTSNFVTIADTFSEAFSEAIRSITYAIGQFAYQFGKSLSAAGQRIMELNEDDTTKE